MINDPTAEEWMLQYRYFFSTMNSVAMALKGGEGEPSCLINGAEEALSVFRKEMDDILPRIEQTYFLKIEPILFERHIELLKNGKYDILMDLASYSENVVTQKLSSPHNGGGVTVLSPD